MITALLVLLAFASGALISALAFELFDEAFALGGAARSRLGLLAGAGIFVALDAVLDRHVGRQDAARHLSEALRSRRSSSPRE